MNNPLNPSNPPDGAPAPRGENALPMAKRYPILAGAFVGLLLRFVFSDNGGTPWSPMVGAFIYGAPVAVGMVTVYLAERQRRRSWGYYIVAPFFATSLFVVGTLLLLIEGWICAVIIIPMFALLGAVGGLVMGAVCRFTNWPRATVYGFAVLPLLIAVVGSAVPTPSAIGRIERSIVIAAPAAAVWHELNNNRDIRAHEIGHAWAMRIGVPMPVSGTTRDTPDGRVRESRWGKNVYFDEVIQAWEPERHVRWTYRFHPDSFPRHALDDHVVIGGHYFDLLDTAYTLEPFGASSSLPGTKLTMTVSYRISTQFNVYADWVAQLLLGNLSEEGLRMYKARSEG